jgi:hypothetical protein
MINTTFVMQIRARNQDGTPYSYWIDISPYNTLEEARVHLKEYRKEYRKTRRVNEDSRIMKIIREIVE